MEFKFAIFNFNFFRESTMLCTAENPTDYANDERENKSQEQRSQDRVLDGPVFFFYGARYCRVQRFFLINLFGDVETHGARARKGDTLVIFTRCLQSISVF